MKKIYFAFLFCILFFAVKAQTWKNNGQLDNFQEFCTKFTVPLVMPDGTKLFTDFYVPRLRDSLVVSILGANIEIIPKGSQILFYDSMNGQPNLDPFQLPTIFTRTPYGKGAERDDDYYELGSVMSLLGYNYMYQDMRGRYTSGGIYFPMYSDSWNKNAYHPNNCHVLDPYPLTDPRNSNKHEDGYHSIRAIAVIDSAYIMQHGDSTARAIFKDYYKGYPHTNTRLNNGSIGMIGASALGNTQLQLALTHRILDSMPQLKCLLPIVATSEHYTSTGYNGGVFRNRIVTGWLKGQIFTGTDDDLNAADVATGAGYRDNSIHTSADYNLPQTYTLNGVTRVAQQNKFEAANISIDHFTAFRYERFAGDPLKPAGFYPNAVGRGDMDASAAPVDASGEAVDGITQLPRPNLNYSRYTNLQVPVLHLTGWWDIFTEGQINTLEFTRKNVIDSFKNLQKIIIGPWAHQTVASRETGDRTYQENVTDITKVDLGKVDLNAIPIDQMVTSDLLTWFKYNLNYNTDKVIGSPKFIIRAGTKWQSFIGGTQIRIPAYDYVVPFEKMLNFLAGKGTLTNITYEQRTGPNDPNPQVLTVPLPITLSGGTLPFASAIPDGGIAYKDFHNEFAYRMYIAGPDASADSAKGITSNNSVGNYWYSTNEVFPPCKNIKSVKMFLHQDGKINLNSPSTDEGTRAYIHDPNDPILTVGGANMIVRSPDGSRNSQGQMEWTDTSNMRYTMNREGVIVYKSDAIEDSLSIIGMPIVNLWAKTNPAGTLNGPTDTDWNVRIGDEFPDGRIFYVDEGACNARARDYCRAVCDYDESESDRNIPYKNVNIGESYDYLFKMLPIGYCWGKGHKLVVLISSSNFTRYQVNPNLPLEDGAFFRRNPSDGQTYIFNGVEMTPRVAMQRIEHSNTHNSYIDFPVIDNTLGGSCSQFINYPYTGVKEVSTMQATLFPNPTNSKLHVFMSQEGNYELKVTNFLGEQILSKSFNDDTMINVADYSHGVYIVEITNSKTKQREVQKFVKE